MEPHRTTGSIRTLIVLLCILTLSSISFGKESDKTIRAYRIDKPLKIDGQLDDEVWAVVPTITDFKQREPREGEDPTEKTEMKIAYDDNHLYFAFKIYDSEPEKIRASILQREGPIHQDDRIIIGLDTFLDRKNAFIFEISCLGTQGDALVTDEISVNWDWEGVYRSEARMTEEGWELEVAIPFTTIRFAEGGNPVMGIAVLRTIPRKSEDIFWPMIGRDFRQGIFQVSQYGTLEGIQGARRGHDLQLKPYLLAGSERQGSRGSTQVSDAGIDVKYGITTNLTLDLTYNTDFAQVEADNVQINLTRYNLFYPEKREFFLERDGIFSFGHAGEITPFFTRRIGITNEVLGGARVTGQAGPLTLGLLNIQTKKQEGMDGSNYTVARLRGELSPETSIGGIFTNLQGGEPTNRTYGVDFFQRFLQGSYVRGWAAGVQSEQKLSSSNALGINSVFATDRYRIILDYLNVGRNYDPGMGFVVKTDFIRYFLQGTYRSRYGSGHPLRFIDYTAAGTYLTRQDGSKEAESQVGQIAARFESGDFLQAQVGREVERPEVPFTIRSTATIPAGEYEFISGFLRLLLNDSRTLSGGIRVGTGGFYHGRRHFSVASAKWKLSPYFSIGPSLTYNDISLPVPNGTFTATVFGLNIFAATSRDLFANALIQFDNFSRNLQANIRINWIHTPGSNLFLVLNTSYQMPDGFTLSETNLNNRAGIVKLTYLFAL